MFTAAELADLRATAEAGCVDTYDLWQPAGNEVVNGMKRPRFVLHTAGIRAELLNPDPTTVTVGNAERQTMRARLKTPVSAPDPAVGWEYRCAAVASPVRATDVGRRWRVIPARTPPRTWMTARRVEVEEVTR